MINNQIIQSIFQQKQRNGFVGKELVKEVIKELAKSYKQSFPKGDTPLSAIAFTGIVSCICQEAQNIGISISDREVLAEIIKGISS